MRTRNLAMAAGLIACLTACGSTAAPTRQFADSRAAVRAAEEVGAEKEPQAALHLKMANDQIAEADRLMKKGDNAPAARLLERAEVDAELALVLVRDAQGRAEAQKARAEIAELRTRIR